MMKFLVISIALFVVVAVAAPARKKDDIVPSVRNLASPRRIFGGRSSRKQLTAAPGRRLVEHTITLPRLGSIEGVESAPQLPSAAKKHSSRKSAKKHSKSVQKYTASGARKYPTDIEVPVQQQKQQQQQQKQNSWAQGRLLRYENDNIGVGPYNFAYETDDGQTREEHGELRHIGTDQETVVVRGSYSFVGDDGIKYEINYVADENGYRASGPHLPKSVV